VALQQREDELLLAQSVGAFELAGVGEVDQLGDRLQLEVG
jgi:hypothetical protein